NLTTCCISFLLQQRLPPTSPLFPYTTLFRSDQFLHAYYYKQVKDGNRHPYEEFFARNSKNPELALRDALEWWHDADFDHSFEERTIYELSHRLRELMARDRLHKLTEQ